MENVKRNYKHLLIEYETASKLYKDTGLTRLLAQTLDNLEQFERSVMECWSLEKLLELQSELSSKGLMVI